MMMARRSSWGERGLLLSLIVASAFVLCASHENGGRTVVCRTKSSRRCYLHALKCPPKCPRTCVADCVTCKATCPCDHRGGVCEDPRFVGGDGVSFYFHGKKDSDFCLVSDNNLHINAHFIGRRNDGMKRDFTWVQSIAILFGSHRIYIGARKVATWDDSDDNLVVKFDGAAVDLPAAAEGANWVVLGEVASITRTRGSNGITLHIPGNLTLYARVVPITEEESRVHNYGIELDDHCFAHLDLGFKFYSLTQDVDGVLGQTYRDDYRTPVKMSASMPLMGGNDKFSVSAPFAPDCAVARFKAETVRTGEAITDMPTDPFHAAMICRGGFSGTGIVCKK